MRTVIHESLVRWYRISEEARSGDQVLISNGVTVYAGKWHKDRWVFEAEDMDVDPFIDSMEADWPTMWAPLPSVKVKP